MAKRQPVEPRFLAKVHKTEACWLWTAWIERRMVAVRTPYQHSMECCPNGHPYDEENTAITPTGRACKTCKRDANRAYYERNRELTIERARIWRLENLDRAREIARETQRRQRAKKKAA